MDWRKNINNLFEFNKDNNIEKTSDREVIVNHINLLFRVAEEKEKDKYENYSYINIIRNLDDKLRNKHRSNFKKPEKIIEIRPIINYANGVSSLVDLTWNTLSYQNSFNKLLVPRLEIIFFKKILTILQASNNSYYYNKNGWLKIEDTCADIIWHAIKDHKKFGVGLRAGKKGEFRVIVSEDKIYNKIIIKDKVTEHGEEKIFVSNKFVIFREKENEESEIKEISQDKAVLAGDPPSFVLIFSKFLSNKWGLNNNANNAHDDNEDDTFFEQELVYLHEFVDEKSNNKILNTIVSNEENPKTTKSLCINFQDFYVPLRDALEFQNTFFSRSIMYNLIINRSKHISVPKYIRPKLLIKISKLKGVKNVNSINLQFFFKYEEEIFMLYNNQKNFESKIAISINEEKDLVNKVAIFLVWFKDAFDGAFQINNLNNIDINPEYCFHDFYGSLKQSFDLKEVDAARFMVEILPKILKEKSILIDIDKNVPSFILNESTPTIEFSVDNKLKNKEDGAQGANQDNDRQDNDWFDLNIMVRVGDEDVIFLDLFTALANQEEYLLLPSGVYFSLHKKCFDRLRALIKEAKGISEVNENGLTISRFQVGFFSEIQELGIVKKQADEWKQYLENILSHKGVDLVKSHPQINTELRHYQKEGFSWLKFLYDNNLGGVLGDDMGLGKTIQAIVLLLYIIEKEKEKNEDRKNKKHLLIVAPTSVVENWDMELSRFAPQLNKIIMRRGDRSEDFKNIFDSDIIITSYSLLTRDFDKISKMFFKLVILDEAQFLKNYQSKTYANVRKLNASRRIALTGTPMENNLMELWSIFSIVAPGLFGNPDHFRDNFQKAIEKDFSNSHIKKLHSRIRPFFLRRMKEEVAIELPKKTEQIIFIEMNEEHKYIYDKNLQLERKKVLGLLNEKGGLTQHRFQVLKSITKMRQLSLHPALINSEYLKIPSSKLEVLGDHIDTIVKNGHKLIIFSQFTSFLTYVQKLLNAMKIEFAYLDGSTKNRSEEINKFQKDNNINVFVISLKAGGFGLNLTAADYCIVMDPWWNPAVEDQAISRLHRIGQHKNVFVYKMITKGSIEEKVLKLQEKKRALFDNIINHDGSFNSLITEKDLYALFE